MYNKKIPAMVFILALLLATFGSGRAVFGQPAEFQEDVVFLYETDSPAIPAGNFNERSGIKVSADAAVVMDADTGQVLYAKNPYQPRPIASTTKIMTALLAIECGDLQGMVTVSPHAAGVEGSSIYLRAGEKLSLEELLYGALMNSGNDACVAIAEHIAGREDIFVHWMNYKASLLGLKNTHFGNTNGLPHKEHLSSAYDLAVLTRYALNNPVFSRIVASKKHVISGPREQRYLSNTNQMLWSYKGANGVKTGTTSAAGKCLVSSACRDGRRLIAVVLHSDNRYADSIKLLNYGFNNYKNVVVVRSGQAISIIAASDGVKPMVPVGCSRDILVTVPAKGPDVIEKDIVMDQGINAPVKPGLVVGSLMVMVEGNPVAGAKIITLEQVDKLPVYVLVYSRIRNKINSPSR